MAQLTFDDLIPAQSSSKGLTFDDLIPTAAPAPASTTPTKAPEYYGIGAGEFAGMQTPESSDIGAQAKILKEQARTAADTATFGLSSKGLGAASYAFGGSPSYGAGVQEQRQKLADYAAKDPYGAGIASGIGGAGLGLGLAKSGLSLAPRLANSGLLPRIAGLGVEGGAIGAAQGAGHNEGDLAAHLEAAKQGGETGALIGAGLPVIGSAIGAAANLARPGVQGIGRTATNILQAFGAGNPRVAQALQQYGPEASLADASPALLGGAQATIRGTGPARDQMTNFFEQRAAGRDPRLAQSFNQNFGQPVSPEVLTESLGEARTAASSPLYKQAFADNPTVNIKPVVDSIQQHLQQGAVGPEKNALLTAYDHLTEPISTGGRIAKTDGLSVHKAKVALDSLVSDGNPALGVPEGGLKIKDNALINNSPDPAERGILPQLTDALKGQVPGYADAAAKSHEYATFMEHVEEGVKAAKPSTFPGQVNQALRDATPDQTTMYREGYLGALAPTIGNAGNELSAAKKVMGGEMGWPRQKSNAILGAEPTSNFVNRIGAEQRFSNTEGRTIGNSVTEEKRAAGEAMDAMAKQWQVPWNLSVPGAVLGVPQRLASYGVARLAGSRSDAIQNALAKAYTLPGADRDALVQALQQRGQGPAAIRNSATDPRILSLLLGQNAAPQSPKLPSQ